MPDEPTTRGTAVIFQAVRRANRSRAPAAQTPDSRRIRVLPGGTHAKEIYAGAILVALAAMAAIGWATASARPAPEAPTLSAEPPKAYQFASNSIYTGSITAATALILIGLIAGAAVVGILLLPTKSATVPGKRPRPKIGPHLSTRNSCAAPPKRGRTTRFSHSND